MAKIKSENIKETKKQLQSGVDAYEAKIWGQIARKKRWPRKKKK